MAIEENTESLVAEQLAEGARLLPDSIASLASFFCGCGDPEAVWEWVKTYLSMLNERSASRRDWPWKPETGPEYLSVYLLDHLGFMEHGGTVDCPWLLPAGEEALAFLSEHGSEWASRGWWIDSSGVTLSDL